MPDRGENDPAQMFQQILQPLTQGGSPHAFDFTRDPKAGGMAPADAFDFTTAPTTAADFDNNGDVDGRDFLVWRKADGDGGSIDDLAVDPSNPNAPEPYMEWKLKEVMISGYSNTGDGGIIIDWTPGPEAESPTGRTDDVFNLVLPSVPLAVQDDGLLLPAVQTGGVSVACGDVNGDTSALGDPITFTYTVRNTSSAYEGTHALYQDVVIPSTAPEPGEVWDWNKKVMDGDIGGSIDFKPQLTSEPTAAEANGTGSFMIANVGDPAPVDYGTGSFIIQNVSDPATIDASLVFGSTGGDRSTVLLPYIEQHGGEANDGGFVIDWTATDSSSRGAGEVNHSEFSIVKLSDAASPKALDEISGPVDDLIGWEDDMGRSFDLVFPTQTAFEQREGNAVATESLEIAHEGFLGDHDDGWCMVVEISFPESGHALYDLVM